jgi:hypothetical protein
MDGLLQDRIWIDWDYIRPVFFVFIFSCVFICVLNGVFFYLSCDCGRFSLIIELAVISWVWVRSH